jgi:V/A-type H+-transporting ATPase subunit B
MGGVPGVAAGSRVQLQDHAGRLRSGLVIRASDDAVLVEVFEGTDELDLERTWVRFLDEPFKLPLSRDILGRVFNGAGLPRDGRPPIISADRRDVNGEPLNPAARAYPREFIQTGISAIDGMNSLTRGQKLPVFSGGGLPHNRVAAQIVRQAKLLGEEAAEFVVVFAAFGASHSDARFFQESFEESGVLNKVVMFLNLADEPVIERLLTPRAALTAAEYLAFDLDHHVLVVMTDMTAYAEALRDVAVLPFPWLYDAPEKIAETMTPEFPIALIENDCALVLGKTILDAFDRLEVLESTAEAVILSRSIGEVRPMGGEVIDELIDAFLK